MELWIRSQDKKHLIKADYVSIMENNIINVASSGWDYDVAKYKSKERALEVLDEIQRKIENTIYIPLNITDVSKQIYNPPFMLYEMPED